MSQNKNFPPFLLALIASILLLPYLVRANDDEGLYKIGVGMGDITGPPSGVVLNGYVNPITNAAGIYTRQFARAFTVESLDSGNAVVYVTTDQGMIDHSVKAEVVKKLRSKYGDKYSEKNVMISATHTHSGVSGFMTYFAYILIEAYQFNPVAFWSAVDGIYEAIEKATESVEEGYLFWNKGRLEQANGNRRGQAYDQNPEEEREEYGENADRDMTLLKLVKKDGEAIGAFTWFPVHPISFNGGLNPLVSSDNKGYAALLFDHEMNPEGTLHGKGKFVSGFGSANLGDLTPNNGPPSEETPDARLEIEKDMEDVRNNAVKQFRKAMELFNDVEGQHSITGPVGFAHQFVNAPEASVDYLNETSGETETLGLCKAALGLSFVSEDLDPETMPWLEDIRDLIKEPSAEMVECQLPKYVAVAAGEMDQPWEWAANIFALQVFQIGNVNMVALPGEYTTMAGRRVRKAVRNVAQHEVILAGLTNNYVNYITTPEEYDFQAYEGGGTIYGRNTVPVTATLFKEMAQAILDGEADSIPDGPTPPYFLDKVRDQLSPWADPIPALGKTFGDLVVDARESYNMSLPSTVIVRFKAGSPRNSPMRGGTFLLVEKQNEATNAWIPYRTDTDVDTSFYWAYVAKEAEIKWYLNPETTATGTYRIRHFGYYRLYEDAPSSTAYSGVSRVFTVTI